MKNPSVETMTEEELEKILLIGKIKHYEDLADKNCLIDYYISTGEITFDLECAKKFLESTFEPTHKELSPIINR